MKPAPNNDQRLTTNQQAKKTPAGIYIHVPFCLSKCPYCDFYSVTSLDIIDEYIGAVITELHLRRQDVEIVDTIYFGGGTPSILTPQQLEKILGHLYHCFVVTDDAEITLEANPGTVNRGDLSAYRSIGINRLNIGLQSATEETLRFLGRIHSAKQGIEMYQGAREVGFQNVGLDLMYGVPGQSLQSWESELASVVKMEPEHLSCYTLTLEQGTSVANGVETGKTCLPGEKMTAGLFSFTMAYLTANQYDHYEISNFARIDSTGCVDRRSRHNQKYWNFTPYLGFGPAAHSYQRNSRRWNHRSLDTYLTELKIKKLPVAGREILTCEQQMMECVYLGLRQTKGIDIREFSLKFQVDSKNDFRTALRQLFNEDLLQNDAGRVYLTEKGFLFHEMVVRRLIELI